MMLKHEKTQKNCVQNAYLVINISWMQVRLAAASCVTKDITKPGVYGGFPAVRIYDAQFYWFNTYKWTLGGSLALKL